MCIPATSPPFQRQRGVLLLSLILLILAAATFIFLKGLNERAGVAVYDHAATQAALAEAKAALIGYAVTYPDKVNPKYGPGYLPCPADAEDGVARTIADSNPPCRLATQTMTGRFPWATLNTNDIRDGSGSRLWYALSENYRNEPKIVPLNSDTPPGQITIDGAGDIVAVVIAPGPPVPGQGGRGSNPNAAANYLEGENATTADSVFTRTGGAFNDTLLEITRAELMAAVEQRVLGEVTRRLNQYFARHDDDSPQPYDGYPWLSPYAPPQTSAFKSVAGTREGHLPFHYAKVSPPAINAYPFKTSMTITWALDGANEQVLLDGDDDHEIDTDCLETSDCRGADPNFGAVVLNAQSANTTCYWWYPDANPPIPRTTAKNYIRCTATVTLAVAEPFELQAFPGTFVAGTLTRSYAITAAFKDSDSNLGIAKPTAARARTRTLTTVDPRDLQPTVATAIPKIDITITQTHRADGSEEPPRTDQVRVRADENTTGSFALAGVQYDLDVDGGELPGWFVDNDWHQQVYVAFSAADAPGNAATCAASGPCLTLQVLRPGMANPVNRSDVRALALIAGRDLGAARAGGLIGSYFEEGVTPGSNATPGDGTFSAAPRSAAFNDQIRVLGTAP